MTPDIEVIRARNEERKQRSDVVSCHPKASTNAEMADMTFLVEAVMREQLFGEPCHDIDTLLAEVERLELELELARAIERESMATGAQAVKTLLDEKYGVTSPTS